MYRTKEIRTNAQYLRRHEHLRNNVIADIAGTRIWKRLIKQEEKVV